MNKATIYLITATRASDSLGRTAPMFMRRSPDDRRVLTALNALSANVMIADENLVIVYANRSVVELLHGAEAHLKSSLPNYNPETLIGSSIDIFHQRPESQRAALATLEGKHRATIRMGQQAFDLLIQPLRKADGSRGGFVVEWFDASVRLQNLDFTGQVAAARRSQAVIEFGPDGTVVWANANFLRTMGYALSEIAGRNHAMFVEEAAREAASYREFWDALRRGEHKVLECKRIGKGGKEVWLNASYSPVLDEAGRPTKVVKFATDVTAEKLRNAEFASKIDAISKSQATIEFELDGTIITANSKFLETMGCSLSEIQGRHHSTFVRPAERASQAYRTFWEELARGQYQAGEYRRVSKTGQEVYLQASYNPILDLNGKPYKIVKYASNVTKQVLVRIGNERVRGMMESVAAGAEELNASVQEISHAMSRSRENAGRAVERVAAADQQTQKLGNAAKSMSGIVELISKITGQINLLSLNATIESARAGDAGRGFAIVATEVKNLAQQARLATEKITQEIGGLNEITHEVIEGLCAIKQAIHSVSEYVVSTAAAVEQQSTVTNEMSASMQRAAAEATAMAAA